jgi:hypothetical protein
MPWEPGTAAIMPCRPILVPPLAPLAVSFSSHLTSFAASVILHDGYLETRGCLSWRNQCLRMDRLPVCWELGLPMMNGVLCTQHRDTHPVVSGGGPLALAATLRRFGRLDASSIAIAPRVVASGQSLEGGASLADFPSLAIPPGRRLCRIGSHVDVARSPTDRRNRFRELCQPC